MLAPLRISVVFLVLLGGLYPAFVVGVGQAAFPHRAQGSLIKDSGGTVVGSELIAQPFDQDKYFHPRPSAAGADGYDASASSGSNLGPTNKALIDRVTDDAAALKKDNPTLDPLPADLLTTSASGLDPDISVEGALAQAPRVAKARSMTQAAVEALVRDNIRGRDLGVFGEKRVNVLKLNLALDAAKGK